MKLNTFSSELLRKVSKYDTYRLKFRSGDAVHSQWSSDLVQYSHHLLKAWERFNTRDNRVDKKAKYAPLISFFDQEGNYKIATQLEEAYRAEFPINSKDFIEVDKRVNLLYSALEGKACVFSLFQEMKTTNGFLPPNWKRHNLREPTPLCQQCFTPLFSFITFSQNNQRLYRGR